tara:strand:- start:131 stop:595 length:465 start_codon:yes stop_codon:yes gene_type:complete
LWLGFWILDFGFLAEISLHPRPSVVNSSGYLSVEEEPRMTFLVALVSGFFNTKQPRPFRDAVVLGKRFEAGSLLGSGSACLANEAVYGFGWVRSNGEPFICFFKIDFEVGAFEERIVDADLLDVTAIAALAAIHGDDFVIRAVFCALAVETERN